MTGTKPPERDRDRGQTSPWFGVARDFLYGLLIAVVIGGAVFSLSGTWPPFVAVESGSMEPNIQTGDLVFVEDPTRSIPDGAVHGTGIAPASTSTETGYTSFGKHGDVIVYYSDTVNKPVIHRAMFWVSEGENWFSKANQSYLHGADSCAEIVNCPAPNSGFITKGDNNPYYDQVSGISGPVTKSDIMAVGTARAPYLGWVRLLLF